MNTCMLARFNDVGSDEGSLRWINNVAGNLWFISRFPFPAYTNPLLKTWLVTNVTDSG